MYYVILSLKRQNNFYIASQTQTCHIEISVDFITRTKEMGCSLFERLGKDVGCWEAKLNAVAYRYNFFGIIFV
jgi:hypothetical protein